MARGPRHPFTDASRGERIQKVLAEAGVASRRASEELIESGAVEVNGIVVDSLPAWVDPKLDRIVVNGRPLRPHERHLYIMVNKPRGVVSTNSDPEGRVLAIDLVKHPADPRLYPVGRLDIDSSGLLLLTNDGELANRLTHPRYEMHKGYEVMVGGLLDDEAVRKLEEGLFLYNKETGAGARTAQSSLEIVKRDRDRTHLYMELKEGRNRQVRRMMLKVGHPVKRLKRVKMGPLWLKGVAVGQWRELTPTELTQLRKAAGLAKSARGQTKKKRGTKPGRTGSRAERRA
jgi:23S rRNA pseudouridine2605 synthase